MEVEFQCNHCGATIEADSEISGSRAECPACQETVLVPAPGIEAGMDIGGFRIDKRLGVGGMGEVFAATQVAMDRKVALKILPPALTADEKTVERFLHEVRMAAKLEHPNIVTAFDAGKASGYYYLAMSYVDGEDLSARLKRDKRISEEEALNIAEKIAHALDYAWTKHHLLHRDIKPANIMLTDDGIVKLMDMGIAKSLEEDSNLTMQGMLVGTPYYMSPEQATGSKDIDSRCDIYSLGATLYHLVTGVRPFNGPNAMAVIAKHMSETPIEPRSLNPNLSEEFEALIDRMLVRDRDDRFSSWKELRDTIYQIQNGTATMNGPGPTQISGGYIPEPSFESGETGTEFHLSINDDISLKGEDSTQAEAPPRLDTTMEMSQDDEFEAEPESEETAATATPTYDPASETGVKWGVFGAAATGILIILVLVGVVFMIISKVKDDEVKTEIAKEKTELKEREIVGDIASSLAGHEELKMNREDLQEMLDLAREYATNNPSKPDEIREKYQKVIKYAKQLELPKFELEAEVELDKLKKALNEKRAEQAEAKAARVMAELERKARGLAKDYQFLPAASYLDSYSGNFEKETKASRQALSSTFRQQAKALIPLEKFLRQAIRLFAADDLQAFKVHMQSVRNNPALQQNTSLLKENLAPFLALGPRRPNRPHRPRRDIPDVDNGPISQALLAYKKGSPGQALELLSTAEPSLIKQVLKGEIYSDMLRGTWASTNFAGDGYTGKVTKMRLTVSDKTLGLGIDDKPVSTSQRYILGSWLYFGEPGSMRYWELRSVTQHSFKIFPTDDVVVTMKKQP